MTYNPRTLQDLGAFWTRKGGVNLGVVGNQRHCAGFHLGKDRIFSDCACKPDGTCAPGKRWADYSVQTSRDKAGLSNAASAIDLGKLGGSLLNLYKFSSWLARQCVDNAPGTADIREVIYSPDGERVLGYKDGIEFLIPDYGDDSHLTHTHISYYRDSEKRDKRPVFARFFDLPDTATETDMPGLAYRLVESTVGTVTVRSDAPHSLIRVRDIKAIPVPAGEQREVFARVELLEPLDSHSGDRKSGFLVGRRLSDPVEASNVEAAFLLASDVAFTAEPEQDCSGPVAAEHERTRAAAIAAVEAI